MVHNHYYYHTILDKQDLCGNNMVLYKSSFILIPWEQPRNQGKLESWSLSIYADGLLSVKADYLHHT